MKGYPIFPVDLPRLNLGRISIAVLSLLAWFAISNHCALGALLTVKPAPHAACHGEQPTGPAQDSSGKAPCCKILRATVADAAKVTPAQVSVAPPQVAFIPAAMVQRPADAIGWFADTGPPRISFAELVLQQSVLAHAPPRFA